MFVNDICIGILRQCNWRCNYCIASSNELSIDEDAIFEELYPIRNKLETLWISGGEPGLLSKSFWSRLLDSINFNLRICTNGTFVTNGLYEYFEDRINAMMIHCVQELDIDIDPKVLKLVRENSHKISVNVVIHRLNVKRVREFFEKYYDIVFDINFADETFADLYSKNYDYCIDREAAKEIVKQLGPLPKYSVHLSRMTKALIDDNYRFLNPWSNKNYDPRDL